MEDPVAEVGGSARVEAHGVGGVVLLLAIVAMTVWRGFQRFLWRKDLGRQVQWLYLLVGLAMFLLLGLHGTLGAQLAAEFRVKLAAESRMDFRKIDFMQQQRLDHIDNRVIARKRSLGYS